MRCDDLREKFELLWEEPLSAEMREHLTRCVACSQYHRDLRLVRSGLRMWKNEEAVTPSVGFAERLVRQLGELSKAPSVADFFERIGKRFVYATMVLTLMVLLGLALPASGPVRGLAATDIQISGSDAYLASSNPMGEFEAQEIPEAAPNAVNAPDTTNEAK